MTTHMQQSGIEVITIRIYRVLGNDTYAGVGGCCVTGVLPSLWLALVPTPGMPPTMVG